MTDVISQAADDIRSMKVRGAGRIARCGAKAMADFAASYDGGDLEAFRKDVGTAMETLLASRPTAVSLWNGVHASVKGLDGAEDIATAKSIVADNGYAFVRGSEEAVEKIARIGSRRIKDGDTVLTICNSSAAIGCIAEAVRQGKKVSAFACETRPWRQGLLTVKELSAAGADTTLIVDSAVRSVMPRVDRVFVGADTITSSGTLINKVGTSQVAALADEARVEFNVCAETYKFSPLTLFGDMVTIEQRDTQEVARPDEIPAGVKIFNPVFDATPAKYIDNIITEVGVMGPGSVYGVMVDRLGDRVFEKVRT